MQGLGFDPWSGNYARVPQLLRPCTATRELMWCEEDHMVQRRPHAAKEILKNYLLPKYSCGTGIEYHSYIHSWFKRETNNGKKKKIVSKNSEIQLGKH